VYRYFLSFYSITDEFLGVLQNISSRLEETFEAIPASTSKPDTNYKYLTSLCGKTRDRERRDGSSGVRVKIKE
jgi:hypothetical protein